jgi:hypothetical protein
MMNFMRWNKRVRWIHCAAGMVLISALAGCNRDEAKVYHVPKDDSPPTQPAPAPATTPEAAQPDMGAPIGADAMAVPQLKYQLPEGWQEKPPSEMRVASFTAPARTDNPRTFRSSRCPSSGVIWNWSTCGARGCNCPPRPIRMPSTRLSRSPSARSRAGLFEFVSEQPMMGKSRQRTHGGDVDARHDELVFQNDRRGCSS